MQASQRVRCNHALEYAIEQGNSLDLPLLVCFGLMDDYPEANERHYAFMLQGLADVAENLRRRKIGFVMRHGPPAEVALGVGREAALIVCDRGYLRHQKQWRQAVADKATVRVVQVESDVVVPVQEASDKAEFAARTLRPKIHKLLNDYLKPLAPRRPRHPSLQLNCAKDRQHADLDPADPALLAKLKLDRSVLASKRFTGGQNTAEKLLKRFIAHRLPRYCDDRNEPGASGTSTLGAYLHFGNIAPLRIALAVNAAAGAPAADREAFVEELIVRRELAINYVNYTANYDQFDALPPWAQRSLSQHARDPRPQTYSRDELERAATHDPYWNAAMREMTGTGYMHNYMRMYWGKRILEWKKTPREAFADALYLNNKYFLCGRDPNAFTNVAWLFGLHDRPWGERPIFGTIRFMNAAGLERKFDMQRYIETVDDMTRPTSV